jgi:hypothetical protein
MNLIFIIIIVEMKNAKKFLKENFTKSKAVAAKIFNVNARFLSAFIKRDSNAKNEDVEIALNKKRSIRNNQELD